ncbi:MAG: inositol monophosphatase [Desulfopila sp.]
MQAEQSNFSRDSIVAKGTHDYVSYVDKNAEHMLVNDLARLLPEAGFIAEEGTSNSRGVKYNWIIDPLDGTTNFIHGAPPYAVSVALMEEKKIVLGVVYEITLDECFSSATGLPVSRNGFEVNVSDIDTVEGSLIATGLPHADRERGNTFSDTFSDIFMGIIKDLSQHSHGVRRPGSAATDLAYVACGRFDAFFQYNLQPWDVAAGAFLVNQAGGHCSSFTGDTDYIFGKEIVATNGLIHKEFLPKVTRLHTKRFD